MTADIWSAVAACASAVAAGASTIAAFKSFALAKMTAAQALESVAILSTRSNASRAPLTGKSRRATSIYSKLRSRQRNTYAGSGRDETVADTDGSLQRIAEIERLAGGLAIMQPGGKLDAVDLAARLPALHEYLQAIDGLLDDGINELKALEEYVAAKNAESSAQDRWRTSMRAGKG